MSGAILVVHRGARAGERIELPEGETVVGRGEADLELADERVSRRHAALRCRGGAVEVEDLGSSNGTFLDGIRLREPTPLTGGATLRIGNTELGLEVLAPATVAGGAVAPTRIDPTPPPTEVEPPPRAEPEPPRAEPKPPRAEPEPPRVEQEPPRAEPEALPEPEPAAAPLVPAAPLTPASAPPPAAFAPLAASSAAPRGRRADSLLTGPTLLCYGVIATDAVALIAYFALR